MIKMPEMPDRTGINRAKGEKKGKLGSSGIGGGPSLLVWLEWALGEVEKLGSLAEVARADSACPAH